MRTLIGTCLIGALTLLACDRPDKPTDKPAKTSATSEHSAESEDDAASEEDFLRRAHLGALEDLVPLVEAYVKQSDPVRVAQTLDGPLTAPHTPGTQQSQLRDELEAIKKKADQIRDKALEVKDRRRLQSIKAMAARDRWRTTFRGPTSSDALYFLHEVARVIAEARGRMLSSPACDECMDALAALPPGLSAALGSLTTASAENQAAATARSEALALELETLVPLVNDNDATKLLASASALREFGTALAARPLVFDEGGSAPRPWEQIGAKRLPGGIIVRPGQWGAERVRQHFQDEEGYVHEAGNLRSAAEDQLTRFRTMQKELTKRTQASKAGKARPVDATRCTAIWTPMKEFAKTKANLEPKLDCKRVVQWLVGQTMDDDQLAQVLLNEGLVRATLKQSALSRGGLLATLGGRWNLSVAQDLRTVMFAFPLGRRLSGQQALKSLEHKVCAATVALELHTGATDEQLDPWLKTWCPKQRPQAWRAETLADPRTAFEGIPAILIGPTPSEMVPVVEYSWAMYGLSLELAKPKDEAFSGPETANPAVESQLKINIEEIDPETF